MSGEPSCIEIAHESTELFVECTDGSVAGGGRGFKRRVLWALGSVTRIRVTHRMRTVREEAPIEDAVMPLDCVERAIARARELALELAVDQQSSLAIEACTSLSLFPYLAERADATQQPRVHRVGAHLAGLWEVPESWRQRVTMNMETTWQRLRPIELTNDVVWSTRTNGQQQALAMNRLLERARRVRMGEGADELALAG